jgi:hypothetical protein
MPHMVGETAVGGIPTVATHRHSAAGAATLATPAGGPGRPALRAGAAVAVVVAGAAEDSVAAVGLAADVRPKDRSQAV